MKAQLHPGTARPKPFREDGGVDDQDGVSRMLLADGRQLGFAEWGDAEGDLVVVDFHGGPGCRLGTSASPGALVGSGIRWITSDRPGIGLSWPKPGRRVVDFTKDITELLDHLAIDSFVAVGWSMGGPYAAACAAALPERVIGYALLAPAPLGLDAPGAAERMGKAFAWMLARDEPWQMLELYTVLGLEARRNPPLAVRLFSDGLSDAELALFGLPEVEEEFVATIVEATRQGAFGLVEEMRVEMSPWGYEPASIQVPGLLWQGDEDSFVATADAEQWAATVSGLELQITRGDGHLFPFARTGDLIAAIRTLALRN